LPLLEWDDSYSVNVLKIDTQHKRLISIVNELNDAMAEGRGKDILSNTLARLINYTKEHFRDEEQLMSDQGYPDFKKHQAEHIRLTEQVIQFQKEYEDGSIAITIKMMRFLRDWLSNHIKGTDKKYGPYLNERGIR